MADILSNTFGITSFINNNNKIANHRGSLRVVSRNSKWGSGVPHNFNHASGFGRSTQVVTVMMHYSTMTSGNSGVGRGTDPTAQLGVRYGTSKVSASSQDACGPQQVDGTLTVREGPCATFY